MKPVVVDLSHWNSPTDFKAAYASGIRGIIHKATEGTWYKDDKYNLARQKAADAGILWGAYHFFRPGNVEGQVEYFLNFAQPDEHTLLALDHEDHKCSVADVEKFLRLVEEKTKRSCVLYSGHVIKEQLGSNKNEFLGKHRLWLAQYSSTATTQVSWDHYWLWQYSESTGVPGLGNPVDVNFYAQDETQLANEWAGTGEIAIPVPPSPPVVTPSGKVNVIAFGGALGDTFSAGLKIMVMKAKTIPQVDYAEYFPYESANRVMAQVASWRDPTIVTAHSYGLNNFLDTMRKQTKLKIPLFFALDSSQYWYGGGPGIVPENIARVVNYYEQSGWPFAIHGQPLYRKDGSSRLIENIRVADSHVNIDDDPVIQARFITELKREIGV